MPMTTPLNRHSSTRSVLPLKNRPLTPQVNNNRTINHLSTQKADLNTAGYQVLFVGTSLACAAILAWVLTLRVKKARSAGETPKELINRWADENTAIVFNAARSALVATLITQVGQEMKGYLWGTPDRPGNLSK